MSPDEAVTHLRRRHYRIQTAAPGPSCVACGQAWPCPTVVVLDDRDEWRKVAREWQEAAAAADASVESWKAVCRAKTGVINAAEADADRLAQAMREVATYFPADEFHHGASVALAAHDARGGSGGEHPTL